MSSTTFIDKQTVIQASWLNDVNGATYNGTAAYTPAGTGAVTTTVQAKLRESVSVKDFGAVGDGVTDDTAAFNKCPSGIIYIPIGTYLLNSFVTKSNTTYIGSSETYLVLASGGTSICSISDGATNIVFETINFIGDIASSASACQIFDTNIEPFKNNITWINCIFSTFGGMALTCGGLKGGRIINCTFKDTAQLNSTTGITSYPAVWLSDFGASFSQSSDIHIQGCTFKNMFWSAIYALGTRIIITDNSISNTQESMIYISPAASYISVLNNILTTTTIKNISASGVEIGGNYCVVSNNSIKSCSLYGVSAQDCISFTVTGNSIRLCGTGIGIITSSGTTPPRYGDIIGNSVQENIYGIRFYKQGSGAVVQDCNITNNYVARNTVSDVAPNTSEYIVAQNVNLKHNRPIDNVLAGTLVCTSLPIGTQVLLSLGYRPSMIRYDVVGLSDSTGTGNAIGYVTFPSNSVGVEKCISLAPPKGRVTNDVSISMWNAAFSTEILRISNTTVAYNVTTKLWDVSANVVTNTGTDIWAVYTITP